MQKNDLTIMVCAKCGVKNVFNAPYTWSFIWALGDYKITDPEIKIRTIKGKRQIYGRPKQCDYHHYLANLGEYTCSACNAKESKKYAL